MVCTWSLFVNLEFFSPEFNECFNTFFLWVGGKYLKTLKHYDQFLSELNRQCPFVPVSL